MMDGCPKCGGPVTFTGAYFYCEDRGCYYHTNAISNAKLSLRERNRAETEWIARTL
jgi:hypothetical protein